jgi:hypothetical protein
MKLFFMIISGAETQALAERLLSRAKRLRFNLTKKLLLLVFQEEFLYVITAPLLHKGAVLFDALT